jgi:DNA-binding NarL/FixJ family response regulator
MIAPVTLIIWGKDHFFCSVLHDRLSTITEFNVVGIAQSYEECVQILNTYEGSVDLLIIILKTCDTREIQDVREISRLLKRGSKIIVAEAISDQAIVRIIPLKAVGYVKSGGKETLDKIVTAIEHAANGEKYFDPEVISLEKMFDLWEPSDSKPRKRQRADSELTEREQEILDMVRAYKSLPYPQIAKKLGISKTTMDSHMQRIRDKTGKHTKAELVSDDL